MAARLRLLGSVALDEAAGLPVDRRGCLLAYLAVEGGWVSRERLALLFWPDSDETTAKRNLRQLVLRVRRLSLAPALEVTPDALRWAVECDVAEFRRALADGDPDAAVAAYGGPLLDGFVVHDVGGFDAWLDGERDRLRLAFLDVGLRRADELVSTGRFDEGARLLATLHDADPLAEDVLAGYVRALYLSGRRDAALAAYARFERELEEELGLPPLPATRELAETVRRGDALEVPSARTEHAERVSLAPTRLAGRDDARHAVLAAETPVVLLRGEPGIGKSSLLSEALPHALRCRATEGLERLPYHPLAELARGAARLAERLGPYRDDLARLVPELAADAAHAPLDAEVAKARVAEAMARLVEAGGGVLVVDDLQWADPATLEVVLYLAGRGLKVFGAFRSGEVGPLLERALGSLRGMRRLTVVDVGPIDEAAARTMLADLMGREDGPTAFSRRLWQHTGGNPMFMLETLSSLFESGRLRRDSSGWHTDVDDVTVDYSELSVPPAIADVIGRRLEHVSPQAVRALEAIALSRATLSPSVLTSVTGLSPAALAEALDEAEGAGFLRGGALRHDLLRQALDGRVPAARRKLLHGLIAEALEGSADPALVAEHWLAAGRHDEARLAWLQRATELRARGLHPAAIELLSGALDRLSTGEDGAWLRVGLAEAHRESGHKATAAALLAAVRESGEASPALHVRLGVAESWLAIEDGLFARARLSLDEAASVAATLPPDDERDLDLVMLDVSLAREERRHDLARARLEDALELLRRRPPSVRLVQFLTSLAVLLDDAGDSDAALARHREAHALARALGSRYYQVETTLNLVYNLSDGGRHEEAIAAAKAALDLGEYDNVAILRTNLGASYMEVGRPAEALEQYEWILERDDRPHLRLIALGRSASCLGELGRLEEARRRVDEGLAAIAGVEFATAVTSVACAALAYGDRRQVERLAELTRGFDLEALPEYALARLVDAIRVGEAALAVPGVWWEELVASPERRVTNV